MDTISLAFPILYFLFIIALCTYLLIRGITHSFVALFAGAAVLQMIPRLGYLVLQQTPGGFAAHSRYFPVLSGFGMFGTLVSMAAFISLAAFLLRRPQTQPDGR